MSARPVMRQGLVLASVIGLAVIACVASLDWIRFCFQKPSLAHIDSNIPRQTVQALDKIPHDMDAFTQGLAIRDNYFWESTGLHGMSRLRRLDRHSGLVQAEYRYGPDIFGEGLALVADRVFVLSWTSGVGFIHDTKNLQPLRRFTIPSPAWGLAYDGNRLILSDGSPILRFLDARTGQEVGRQSVNAGLRPVSNLNELEIVNGEIWANVWQTDSIARIRPADGQVVGWIDVTGCACRPWLRRASDTLNGIAYDAHTEALYLTGKRWPFILQAKLVTKTPP